MNEEMHRYCENKVISRSKKSVRCPNGHFLLNVPLDKDTDVEVPCRRCKISYRVKAKKGGKYIDVSAILKKGSMSIKPMKVV